MRALRSVKQDFTPTPQLESLMRSFQEMTNEAIRIGSETGKTSLGALSSVAYRRLAEWGTRSRYVLGAMGIARSALKNSRKTQRRPHCSKPFLHVCYVGFDGSSLILPGQIRVSLNPHTIEILSKSNPVVRSVTLSARTLSIAYSKETDEMECTGMLGIDRNVDNITFADTEGTVQRLDLSKATRIKGECRATKRRFKRNDVRVRRAIFGKYGAIERNRVGWILHNASASIVRQAKKRKQAIVMERLKMRGLYRKGNGQSRNSRAMMNSWSYYELQRQIEYKARWEGIRVLYVSARGTSAKCAACGSKTIPNADRTLFCPNCQTTFDRDENAARNILAAGLTSGPKGPRSEAVKGNEPTTPILRVDRGQSVRAS